MKFTVTHSVVGFLLLQSIAPAAFADESAVQQDASKQSPTPPASSVTTISQDEFRALRCLPNQETTYFSGEGDIYARGSDKLNGRLFRVIGVDIARCQQAPDGVWWLLSRELTFYLDPKTNEVLHRWASPSGDDVAVIHNANAYQGFPLPPAVPAFRNGSFTTVALEMDSKIPNPVKGDPKFAETIPQDVFDSHESYAFTFTPKEGSLHFTRVGPWLPWMKMGTASGELVYSLTAFRTGSFDALPKIIKDEIRTRLPLYKQAPTCVLKGASKNSWLSFPSLFDAYVAKDRFPLPAPLGADGCSL